MRYLKKTWIKNSDWKKPDVIRNYLIEGINRNEIISKRHKNVCIVLDYIEHLLIEISIITGCVSISAFAYFVGISIGTTSSAISIKVCVTNAGITNYKSINKKNKKEHDKILLLAKSTLNSIKV